MNPNAATVITQVLGIKLNETGRWGTLYLSHGDQLTLCNEDLEPLTLYQHVRIEVTPHEKTQSSPAADAKRAGTRK